MMPSWFSKFIVSFPFAVCSRNPIFAEGRRSRAAVAVRRAEEGDDEGAGGHPLAVHLTLRDHTDAVRGLHAHHRRVGRKYRGARLIVPRFCPANIEPISGLIHYPDNFTKQLL